MATLYQKINGQAVRILGGGGGTSGSIIRITCPEDYVGNTITFAMAGIDTQSAVVGAALVVEFTSTELGTATVTNTDTEESFSFEIDTYSLYEREFSMYGYESWLESASIPDTFGSLEAVLQSEVTLRTLMTKHASVDYLVEWLSADADTADTILNTDLCAKWINLRDYALDSLWAVASIKAVMDTADKYFYGEWIEKDGVWGAKGNVPIMTSNSAPYGESSAKTQYSADYTAYKAFDGNSTTRWAGNSQSATDWLTYKFPNPVCVRQIYIDAYAETDSGHPYSGNVALKAFSVKGSNDNITWETVYTGELENTPSGSHKDGTFKFANDKYYLYYQLDMQTSNIPNVYTLWTLQFYGRELKVSVPTMTSNTEPWGEASASNYRSGGEAYRAFDKNDNTYSNTEDNVKNVDIVYSFDNPVVVKTFILKPYVYSSQILVKNYTIDASNNGTTWETLYSGTYGTGAFEVHSIDNNSTYKYYRIHVTSTNGLTVAISELNFYGLDYSEHEERHYLYDRGVELETITSGKATIDTTDYDLLRAEDTYHATTSDKLACGSANANVNGLPYNNYLDISSVNGSNATGWTNVGDITDTSFWVE